MRLGCAELWESLPPFLLSRAAMMWCGIWCRTAFWAPCCAVCSNDTMLQKGCKNVVCMRYVYTLKCMIRCCVAPVTPRTTMQAAAIATTPYKEVNEALWSANMQDLFIFTVRWHIKEIKSSRRRRGEPWEDAGGVCLQNVSQPCRQKTTEAKKSTDLHW